MTGWKATQKYVTNQCPRSALPSSAAYVIIPRGYPVLPWWPVTIPCGKEKNISGATWVQPSICRTVYLEADLYHNGQPHDITQAEGGEQGDPFMPALYSLGQRAALQTLHSNLGPGETLFAFLDDVYVVLPPHRVRPVYDLLQHHL